MNTYTLSSCHSYLTPLIPTQGKLQSGGTLWHPEANTFKSGPSSRVSLAEPQMCRGPHLAVHINRYLSQYNTKATPPNKEL